MQLGLRISDSGSALTLLSTPSVCSWSASMVAVSAAALLLTICMWKRPVSSDDWHRSPAQL